MPGTPERRSALTVLGAPELGSPAAVVAQPIGLRVTALMMILTSWSVPVISIR